MRERRVWVAALGGVGRGGAGWVNEGLWVEAVAEAGRCNGVHATGSTHKEPLPVIITEITRSFAAQEEEEEKERE